MTAAFITHHIMHACYGQAENVNVTHFVTEFCEDDITYV